MEFVAECVLTRPSLEGTFATCVFRLDSTSSSSNFRRFMDLELLYIKNEHKIMLGMTHDFLFENIHIVT